MGHGLSCKVAVVGGGPAGCFCAYLLQNFCHVTVFEAKSPLATLLPTGGGRCNLAHAEFDFKELASNYPRGEKFLYSIFSRFSTADTLEFFQKIGVETYIQDDLRIFPLTNSAVDVREKFLHSLENVNFIEKRVDTIVKNNSGFTVFCDKREFCFDKIILAIGGHGGFTLAEDLGHSIISPKPALCGLRTNEDFVELSGVSFKNVRAEFCGKSAVGDLMFTHTGVTGPLIYYISSIMAREQFPYNIYINFVENLDLQVELNNNPQKDIKNLLSEFIPKSFAEYILRRCSVPADKKCHLIDGKSRDKIHHFLQAFKVTAVGTRPDGEVVTSGGVDLKEINPKTMESKITSGLYFCGEVLDIDGFCGGFNLQNCWSTAYIVSEGIKLSQ